ncbi:MAG: OmpH family outer membrane protein [Hydrogenophaga sp.]|nr:OmpH family outer membrane protein [Hydrogenophaga sp.]NIN28677.1 OmpH family outer membrane protein [Hydrogenophaga sp.]NIN33136.1 OmpH family outer membrane protein [Hydrogenophaga sp.]NIN57811.1 OmpH family outer membrane protein [Hydrogenophaga sp.]NIO54106.1 OmpH family outer membrane protein [Hydrogenophaga sp.]
MRLLARHFALAVSLALAMVGGAAAQDAKAGAKVGAVNVERILRDSSTAKAVSAKLEQDFSKRERDLRAAADQLRQAVEKFERESPTLPESQRAPRQRQLVDQERDLQRRQRDFQEELNLRRNEALQQVVEKLNRVIRTIAEAEKYDLIVQEAYYVSPRVDITDRVMSQLDSAK